MWNRTSFNFWKARARWPGLNLGKPLRFCAPEVLQNLASTRPPVMGVLGDGRHGGRGGTAASADCARPLASFGSFSTWKRNSPRRAKPLRNGAPSRGPGQLLLPLRGNSPSRVLRLESKGTGRRGRAPALQSSSNDACSSDCPLIRPSVRTGAPFPIPSVAARHLPLTRGVGPQGEGLKRAGGGDLSTLYRTSSYLNDIKKKGGPSGRPEGQKGKISGTPSPPRPAPPAGGR